MVALGPVVLIGRMGCERCPLTGPGAGAGADQNHWASLKGLVLIGVL